MNLPKDGGTAQTLTSGQAGPFDIAVDSTNVYWTNQDGTVMKVPLGGGTPVRLASKSQLAFGIAVDTTSVYWANDTQQGTIATGTIMKVTPK